MSTRLLQRLRGPRVFGMAVFDWAASLGAAVLVGRHLFALRFCSHHGAAWAIFLLGWIAMGVLVHLWFAVPTTLGYYLGLNAATTG